MNKIKINEIFRSIQGESTHMGKPCIFIRLTGCNLNCTYCDTLYAHNEGKKMTIKQAMKKVMKIYQRGDIIEITGGETLLQMKEVEDLVDSLNDLWPSEILIETNGSILIPRPKSPYSNSYKPLDRCIFIMDYKLPSSGMNHYMEILNMDRLRDEDELKFVIGTREDFNVAIETIKKYKPKAIILMSPVFGKVEPKDLAKWVLDSDLNIRMQLQMHKYIWEPTKRGV